MVAAAAISEQRYGFDRADLVEVVRGAGLPVGAPGLDRHQCLRLISRDKKRAGQTVRMVLLEAPGSPVLEDVTGEEIDLALSAVQVEG
jgi:3-dehydroquinate synthetase